MDLDDLLGELFGSADVGLTRSRRIQLLARMAFGFIGAGLGLVGAWFMLAGADVAGSGTMRVSMAVAFVALAAFCTFNVMLGRAWRWPWLLCVAGIVALFASRLAGV